MQLGETSVMKKSTLWLVMCVGFVGGFVTLEYFYRGPWAAAIGLALSAGSFAVGYGWSRLRRLLDDAGELPGPRT